MLYYHRVTKMEDLSEWQKVWNGESQKNKEGRLWIFTYLLCVMEGPREKTNKVVDSSMFTQRCMICWAQGQISDQSYHRFHQWPSGWGLQQLYNHLHAVVQTYTILCHLWFHMSWCQMAQGTNSRFCYLFSFPCIADGTHQSIYATHLAYCYFIALVVACQVWEDASSTCHNINVSGYQKLNQAL